jgi:predicted nucleic acid-binding protein
VAFLLDTNVAIHLRDGDSMVTQRVAALEGAVLISLVTRVELEGGVYRERAQAPVREGEQHVMQSRSIRRSGQPIVPVHRRMRAFDRDLIRGGHYGQRSCEPRQQAEHIAAPTNAAT